MLSSAPVFRTDTGNHTLTLPKDEQPIDMPMREPPVRVSDMKNHEKDTFVEVEEEHGYTPGLIHALLADTQEAFTGISEDMTNGTPIKDVFTKFNRLRGIAMILISLSLIIFLVYIIKHT